MTTNDDKSPGSPAPFEDARSQVNSVNAMDTDASGKTKRDRLAVDRADYLTTKIVLDVAWSVTSSTFWRSAG